MVNLDKADTALRQPPRHETIRGETAVAGMFHAIQFEEMLGFPAEIGQFGHRCLHAKRHFILSDAGVNFRVRAFPGQQAVEPLDFLDHLTLRALADAFGIAHVMDGVAFGLKKNAFKPARQETGGPLPGRNRLGAGFALRGQHDKAGQLVGLRAETVEQPGAHAGPALDLRAGVHERVRRIVVDLLGVHRADDANVVRNTADVREQLGNFLPGSAPLPELAKRPAGLQFRVLQLRELLPPGEGFGERFIVELLEFRLVIKTFEVRRPARHAEMNDAFGPHRKMGRLNDPFPSGRSLRGLSRAQQFGIEQAGQRQTAEPVGGAAQKSAPIDAQWEFVRVERVHNQKFKAPRSKLKRNTKLNIPKPARTDRFPGLKLDVLSFP